MTRADSFAEAEFFRHMPQGMARVSLDGRFELVNDALCRMLGYARDELLTLDWRSITHPEDLGASDAFAKRAQASGTDAPTRYIEKRYVRKDGSILFARATTTVMFDADGAPAYMLSHISEIEDAWRKRRIELAHRRVLDILTQGGGLDDMLAEITHCAEEADPRIRAVVKLVDSSGSLFDKVVAPSFAPELRAVLTNFAIHDGVTSCGTAVSHNCRVIVNDALEHPDWTNFREFVGHADFRGCISEPVVSGDGHVSGVFTLTTKDPWTPSPLDLSFSEGMARLVALAIDRYRMLEALRISRARFQTMIEHAPEAVLLIDYQTGRFVEANERVREVYHVSPVEMLTRNPWDFAPPQQPDGQSSRDVLVAEIDRALAGESPVFEYIARDGDGKDFEVEVRLTRLPAASGKLVRASVIDLAARNRTAKELGQSEAQLRTILQSIDDALIATDRQGVVTHFNAVAERLTGRHADQVIGRTLALELVDPESGERVDSQLAAVLRDERTVNRVGHVIVRAADGVETYVSERAAPIRGNHGRVEGMVLVLRDVSQWREAQERTLQSRKLEAIGQLAGGVAHDFNNLLTSILGNAELLDGHADERVRRAAGTIALAARRSADVTGQLLRFSRKDTGLTAHVDMHELLREGSELLRLSLERSITLELDLEAQHTTIDGEPSELQNAILNLCLNARDAIHARRAAEGDGAPPGRISIRTSNPAERADRLVIEVADNGCGIPDAVRAHIFEPFYTTKEIGTGTGLGLASTYGTLNALGGSIDVSSTEGEGTEFVLELPLALGPDKVLVPRPRRERGTGARVLVVDDEDLVRQFVMRALRTLDYEVSGAANGLDAERLFKEEHFDLVLLDLVMPKRGGMETFAALRAIDPRVPVIIASGYSREHNAETVLAAGATAYLSKPFQIAELSNAVRSALAGQQAGERRPSEPAKG